MPTGSTTARVSRVRTYRDDLLRAKGQTAAPEPSTPPPQVQAMKEVPKKPSVPVPTSALPDAALSSLDRSAPPARTFHTDAAAIARDLQKIKTRTQASVLSETDDPLNMEFAHDLGDGSIVTDTKRNRFKLLPAVKHAFTEWLFEKKEAYEERKKPKFTMAPASDRKEVIERAATGGVLAPKNDYETVATRLRHVPRVKISVKPTVRSASEVPKPTWSHEVKDPLPEPAPRVPPPPVEPRIPPPPEPPAPIPEPVIEAPPVIETPPPQKIEPPIPEPTPVPVPQAAPTARPTRAYAPSPVASPSRLRQYLLVAVAIIAIGAGIGITVWFFGGGEATAPRALPERSSDIEQSMITAGAANTIALASSREAFFEALVSAANESERVSVLYLAPVVSENERVRAARVDEILSVLHLNAPGTFIRAIDAIGFGALDQETPFVILHVPTFDTALGGMLAWEASMSADLAPLFGTPVSAPTFVDVVHSNRDMRILSDAEGDDRIVYSFPNRTTILITTTRTAAERLLPLVR